MPALPARAQTTGVTAEVGAPAVIQPGHVAVTGFSGTTFPAGGLPPGVDPIGETMIDLDGASLRIFKLDHMAGPPRGQLVPVPEPLKVKARTIGQVFGLAFDDGKRDGDIRRIPNLFIAAGSMHGLQVVIPDADGDGRPERVRQGQAGAQFMDGQHGLDLGGGPGSIYKLDGLTGDVTLFADIKPGGVSNSGPGLGNIAFDGRTRQLFVSDLDTGLIHRLDAVSAADNGQFDHGAAGRPKKDLAPVADDGKRMDLTSAAFKTENPATWGFTQAERRIHGLAVNGRRLYYAVAKPLQVWSVGIKRDGSFADDPRWELDVSSDSDHPVTDIVFDHQGFMYLAQRGHVNNAFDYSVFAEPAKSTVLRYHKKPKYVRLVALGSGDASDSIWVEEPRSYAVGFPEGHAMALGGIDLTYGYRADGAIDRKACEVTLVKTGEDLRNAPALTVELAAGGALNVHGLQLTKSNLVRPKNVPPWKSYFVDMDGLFMDPEVRGHVGDVEVWRPCAGRLCVGEVVEGGPTTLLPPSCGGRDCPTPGTPPCHGRDCPPPGTPTCTGRDCPPPRTPTCVEIEHVEYICTPTGINASIWLRDTSGLGSDALKAQSLMPSISVSPPMQTVAVPGEPFALDFTGALAGDKVDVNVCFHRSADAVPGRPFPCCQARISLTLPSDVCRPF